MINLSWALTPRIRGVLAHDAGSCDRGDGWWVCLASGRGWHGDSSADDRGHPVPETQVPGNPRPAVLRLGLGALGPGRAGQALAAGLVVQVGDPGLGQSVADGVGGV